MSKTEVLLVIPPGGYYAERWSGGTLMPPLGVGYVAAALEQAGIGVGILDAHVNRLTPEQIAGRLRELNPRIVGVTCTTETRFEGFSVLAVARRTLPDSLIIAGGPHVSLAAEDTLSKLDTIDAVVRGEGEAVTVALAKAILGGGSPEGVPGVSWRRDGQIIENPSHPAITDLDSLPFPARHLYPPLADYNFVVEVPARGKLLFANIMTSRGCPVHCNFCATPIMWGRQCRLRSVDNMIAEMEELVGRYHVRGVWIFDDTFNASPERVHEFCDQLIRRDWNLSWFCEVRVDRMNRELLEHMKAAGCFTIGFGVESGSQRILDEVIGKHLQLEQVHQLMAWCRESGVRPNPFYILSHPTETWQEVQQTMEMISQYRDLAQASMALLHVYPGTKLETIARRNGSLPADFSWTDRDRTDVRTLPSAQGNVPLFLDKLTWDQISRILFQWADMQGYSVWKKIPHALSNIRTATDVWRYLIMAKAFAWNRLRGLCRR